MQLEESGTSKDVPPLSCRETFDLSKFVENRVGKLNITKKTPSVFAVFFHVELSQTTLMRYQTDQILLI